METMYNSTNLSLRKGSYNFYYDKQIFTNENLSITKNIYQIQS